jgi:hypothetical protein
MTKRIDRMAQPGVGVDFETSLSQEEIELVLRPAIRRFAIGIARREQVIVSSAILGCALTNALLNIHTVLERRDLAITGLARWHCMSPCR